MVPPQFVVPLLLSFRSLRSGNECRTDTSGAIGLAYQKVDGEVVVSRNFNENNYDGDFGGDCEL